MGYTLIKHPLIDHKMTILRKKKQAPWNSDKLPMK